MNKFTYFVEEKQQVLIDFSFSTLARQQKQNNTTQTQCRRKGEREPCSQFGLAKITFLEHCVMARQPTMVQKEIITFNPTYLTNNTYIRSRSY